MCASSQPNKAIIKNAKKAEMNHIPTTSLYRGMEMQY